VSLFDSESVLLCVGFIASVLLCFIVSPFDCESVLLQVLCFIVSRFYCESVLLQLFCCVLL